MNCLCAVGFFHDLFQRVQRAVKLIEHCSLCAALAEDRCHPSHVPDVLPWFTGEGIPCACATAAQICRQSSGIGNLVRGVDQAGFRQSGIPEMVHVGLLALHPLKAIFFAIEFVGTILHHARHVPSELPADTFQRCAATIVFRSVVQQRCYGLVFAATVLHHQGGDVHKVRYVRNALLLACLTSVQFHRERQRANKALPCDEYWNSGMCIWPGLGNWLKVIRSVVGGGV